MAQAIFKLVTVGRIIDGREEKPLENGAVLLEGTKIRQVGRALEVRAPEGAAVEEYHYTEGSLLPGLVDAHTHFNYRGDGTHTDDVMQLPDDILLMRSILGARTHLESGVTTVRENGAKNRTAFSLQQGHRLGLVAGPRMLVCGRPVTITGGHAWQMGSEADGVDGVRKAVRQLVKEGADWIKVPATGGSTSTSYRYRPSFSLEELRAIVEEAHKFGKLVGTHCLATSGIVMSLDAGVDMLIHGYFQEADGSWKFRPEVAERIAREGTPVNPTLHIGRARVLALHRRAEEGAAGAVQYGPEQLDLKAAQFESDRQLENARRLLQAGVRMIPGSDAGFGWYPFGEFWRELECFSEIGMTPMRAILTGTHDAAEAIGASDITGTLEVGKEADLLVVKGDPSLDITALGQVLAVFQGGTKVN
jgi:imidazolonepropionase-like amidohydrolase